MVIKKIIDRSIDDIGKLRRLPGQIKNVLETPMTRRQFIGAGIKKINPNAYVDIGGIPTADDALGEVQSLADSALTSWRRNLPGRIYKNVRNKALGPAKTPISILDELADLEITGQKQLNRRAFLEKLGNKARNYNSAKIDPVDNLKKRPPGKTGLEAYEDYVKRRKSMNMKEYLRWMEEYKDFSYMDTATANFKGTYSSSMCFNPNIGDDVKLPQAVKGLYDDKKSIITNKLVQGPNFVSNPSPLVRYGTKRTKNPTQGLLRNSNYVNRQLGAI